MKISRNSRRFLNDKIMTVWELESLLNASCTSHLLRVSDLNLHWSFMRPRFEESLSLRYAPIAFQSSEPADILKAADTLPSRDTTSIAWPQGRTD